MSHDEPTFGERVTANDPEALHDAMVARGYEPWTGDDAATDKELEALGPYTKAVLDPEFRTKVAPERGELGRTGKIVVSVVGLAIITPFIILLWHWALNVVGW